MLLVLVERATACVMLNGENGDLICRPIKPIIDEIRISASDKLAHIFDSLTPAHLGKQDQTLQSIENLGTNALCSGRIMFIEISGGIGKILGRARCET